MSRILVTGGGGFLGGAVVRRLKEFGHEVHWPRSWVYDLRRHDAIRRMLDDIEPEIVVHAAAAVGGIRVNQAHPGRLFYENAIMGIELMEQARLTGVGKFVTIGTACEYPADASVPLAESDLWDGYPADVTAPYGLAKKMLLVQAQAYRAEYGFDSIHLICANLYGPRDNFDPETSHVVPGMIRRLSEAALSRAASVMLWGSGRPTRDFLYITDAAQAIALATEDYDGAEPMNIGTGQETSIGELALMIAETCGFTGEVLWNSTSPEGTQRRSMDVSRAKAEIGWAASTPLEEGIRNTIQWFQAKVAA